MLTKHAEDRMKQRGFTMEHIDFILRHGLKKRIGDAVRHSLTKQRAKELSFRGCPKALVEKCKSTFVVVAGELVITVAHMH